MLFDLLGASEIQTTTAAGSSSGSAARRGSGAADRPPPPDDDLNDSGSGFTLERQQTTVGVNRLESLLDTAEAELRRLAENAATPSRSFRGGETPPPIPGLSTTVTGQSPFAAGAGIRSINGAGDGERTLLGNSARYSPATGGANGLAEDELSPAQSALFEPRSPTEAEAFLIVWRVITDTIFQEELLLGEGSASLFVLQNFHYIVDLATSLVSAKSFAATISLPRGGTGGVGGLVAPSTRPDRHLGSSRRESLSVGSPYGAPPENEEDEDAKVAHVMAVAHASGLKALDSRPSSVALQSLLARVKRDEKLAIAGSQPTSLSSTIQDWEALDVTSGSIAGGPSIAGATGGGTGGGTVPTSTTFSPPGGLSNNLGSGTASTGASSGSNKTLPGVSSAAAEGQENSSLPGPSSGVGLLVAIGGSTSSLSSNHLLSPQSATAAPNRSTSALGYSHSISPNTRPKHSTITLETLQRRNEHELFCAALPSLCEGVLSLEEKDLLMESIRFLLTRLAQNPARRSELSPAVGHLLTKNKNIAIHHAAPAIKQYVHFLEQTYDFDALKNLFCALADELHLLLASTAPPPALKGACLQGFCTALFAPNIALSKCPATALPSPSPSSGMRAQSTATFRSESTSASELSGNQPGSSGNGSRSEDHLGDMPGDPEQMNVLEPMLRILFEAAPVNVSSSGGLGDSSEGSNQRSSSSPLSLIQSADAPGGAGSGGGAALPPGASTPKGEKETRGKVGGTGTFTTVVTNSAPQGQSRPPLLLIRHDRDKEKHVDPMAMNAAPSSSSTIESWALEEKADLLRTGQRALAGILAKSDTAVFWTQAVLRSYRTSLLPDPDAGTSGGSTGDSFSRSNSSWASPTSPGSTLATRYMSFPTEPLMSDFSSHIRQFARKEAPAKTATTTHDTASASAPPKSGLEGGSFSARYAKMKKKSGLLSLLCWIHEVLDQGAQEGLTGGGTNTSTPSVQVEASSVAPVATAQEPSMCVTPPPTAAVSANDAPPPKASVTVAHAVPSAINHATFEDRVIAVDLLASVVAWWYGGAQEFSESVQNWMSAEAITSCVAAATGTLLRLAGRESATGSSDLFYHSFLNLVLTLEPLGAYRFSYCPLGPVPGGGKFFTDDLIESDYDPFNALQLEFTVLPTLETARGKKGAVLSSAGLSTGSYSSTSSQGGSRADKKNFLNRPRAQTLFAGELKRILSRRRSGREIETTSTSPSVTPMSTPSNSRCNRTSSGGGAGSSGRKSSSHQRHHHGGLDSATKIPDDTADLAAPVAHTMGALLSLQQHCGSTVTIAFDTSEDSTTGSVVGGNRSAGGGGGGSGNNATNCRPVPWKKPRASTPGSAVGSPFLSPSQTGRTVDLFGQSPPHSSSMNSSHSSAPPVDLFSAISLTAGFSTPPHFSDPSTGGTAPVDLFSSWST